MANILDILASNRKRLARNSSGVLTEESTEGIKQLAGKVGLPVPTDPLSAMRLGASKDQQKMMGTPQQTQAALNQALLNPALQLGTEQRRGQRATATAAQRSRQQQAGALQELSNVPRRVQQFIQGQTNKLAQEQLNRQLQVIGQQQLQELPIVTGAGQPVNYTDLKSKLEVLGQDPNNLEALRDVNLALGRQPNQLLTPEELGQFYQQSAEAIASGAQGLIDTDLTIGDLLRQENFPYEKEGLADLLELSPDEVEQLSVGELRNRITELSAPQSQTLGQQAVSPLAGIAERRAAQQAFREAEETGEATTERQLENLENALRAGEVVNFAGQAISIEELLGDDTISQTIQEYLEAPEGSLLRQNLEETEPGLVQFINNNSQLLSELSGELRASSEKLSDIQAGVSRLQQVGNVRLSDKVFDSIISDQIFTEEVNPEDVTFLATLKKLPQDQAERLAASINAAIETRPDLADQFSNLTEDQILRLADPTAFNRFMAANAQYRRVSDMSLDDIDGILSEFFGISTPEVEGRLQEEQRRANLGLQTPESLSSILDKDRDGKIDVDVPAALLDQLRAEVVRPDLISESQVRAPRTISELPRLSQVQQSMLSRFSTLAQDQRLTEKEVRDEGVSDRELVDLLKSGVGTPEFRADVQGLISQARQKNTQDIMKVFTPIKDTSQPTVWGKLPINTPDYLDNIQAELASLKAEKNNMIEFLSAYPPELVDEKALEKQFMDLDRKIQAYAEASGQLVDRLAMEEVYNKWDRQFGGISENELKDLMKLPTIEEGGGFGYTNETKAGMKEYLELKKRLGK